MTNYEKRDEILRGMGFASYSEYLESDTWKGIRKVVLLRANRRCVGCKGRAAQVHHKQYTKTNLSGDGVDGLVAICRACHEAIDLHKDGSKTSLAEANALLERIIKDKPGVIGKAERKPRAPRNRNLTRAQRKAAKRKQKKLAKIKKHGATNRYLHAKALGEIQPTYRPRPVVKVAEQPTNVCWPNKMKC